MFNVAQKVGVKVVRKSRSNTLSGTTYGLILARRKWGVLTGCKDRQFNVPELYQRQRLLCFLLFAGLEATSELLIHDIALKHIWG